MNVFKRVLLATGVSLAAIPAVHATGREVLTPTGDVHDIPVVVAAPAKKLATSTVLPVHLSGCVSNPALVNRKAQAHLENIRTYAEKYAVNANIVKAVIAVESCYNPAALSPKGAQGLMQLIPETAARFGVEDAFDTRQNIHGGTRYLSWLMQRYDGDLHKAIAAYNAGEGAVDRYRGIPPYQETQQYVRQVLVVYNGLSGKPVALPAVQSSASQVSRAGKPVSVSGTGRVSATYDTPLTAGKPGRSGWQVNKALAPHLYKQQ